MEWLIAITGLPYEVMILILLAVAGAFAGFVDSIVGGGGLISVPAMLLTNLPLAWLSVVINCLVSLGPVVHPLHFYETIWLILGWFVNYCLLPL